MRLHVLPTGMIQTNCVVLAHEDGRALVVDPGADAPALRALLDQEGLRVIGYPLTHGHYDHVCALADMAETHPAPAWMHPDDLAWAFTPANQAPPWYVQPDPARLPAITPAWQQNGPFSIGPFTFQTLHLPGHSPGSVAFHFPEDRLLVGGDVLFRGSIGRSDLPGGHLPTLFRSLRRLAGLPPETLVVPGHGPSTHISEELRSNPYLRDALRLTEN